MYRIDAIGVQRAGIARTIFLDGETLEMGQEVRMDMAFPRQDLGKTREHFLNSGR